MQNAIRLHRLILTMQRALGRAVLAMVAGAQLACVSSHLAPPHQFLERMYVTSGLEDSTIIYEAQIATHVLLVDDLPSMFDRLSRDTSFRAHSGWRAILTPMFRVRQLSDSSAAVRTPSFMPRLSVEWLHGVPQEPRNAAPNVADFGVLRLFGLRGSLVHHSNGQAGCFREGFNSEASSEECRPNAGFDTSVVRLNMADGDFSSTYLSLMPHLTWIAVEGGWTLGLAGAIDWHPLGIFGALSAEQRELYGSARARGMVEGSLTLGRTCMDVGATGWRKVGCALRGRARIGGEYERVVGRLGSLAMRVDPAILPHRWSIEASHTLQNLRGVGVFVRHHDGQDYYNIGFVRRRRTTVLGVMLDLSGAARIEPQERSP